MNVKFCDKCGSAYKEYGSARVEINSIERDGDYVWLDLCPDCLVLFKIALNQFKPDFFATGSGKYKRTTPKKKKSGWLGRFLDAT